MHGELAGAWRCQLGRAAEGQKAWEGDGRTPEGHYLICTRNAESRFHRFLGLTYPLPSDALRGLSAGRISPAQAAAIDEAHTLRARPPWDTALGGQIGIHGAPNGASMPEGDWTEGCIALENAVIDHLWARCPMGTPVIVAP
jgi:murein L,D-transpeptidase YafK